MVLRLLDLQTQMIDKSSPDTTQIILTPAQTKRILSDRAILQMDGMSVANGRTFNTRAATLNPFRSFFFHSLTSFLFCQIE